MDQGQLATHLESHGQQHLLRHWDQLDERERAALAEQIRAIDFAELARLVGGKGHGDDWAELARRAVGPPAFRLDGRGNRFAALEAREAGQRALSAGKVGALLVAGGQGSRLGFEHPKGMFPIGPVSRATLFQVLFEKLLATARRYGRPVPLYLMTSPTTHVETVDFLEAHRNFGLPAEDLHIFCQGTMPAVDAATGQVLLAAPGQIAASPDGHGGMLAALARSGGLEQIHRRGIAQLFYFQVDNPLVAVCDPEFIGYHLLSGSELSTQVVAKQAPAERVGNVVSIDGQTRIIEYSDLPAVEGQRRRSDGSLELWAGNIAVHVFDVAFLDRVRHDAQALPFHRAHKAVPHLDAQGRISEPKSPNAIKFERFIFDLLPAARSAIVVEVDGRKVFAPVKNASGTPSDSPETVARQMVALHRSWLEGAGVRLAAEARVEISPLAALDADAAQQRFCGHAPVTDDTYFTP